MPSPTNRLQDELENIARPVDQKLRTVSSEQLRGLPVLRLESLERHWKFDALRLQNWQSRLQAEMAPYLGLVADLAKRRASWVATKFSFSDGVLTPLLRGRIEETLTALQATEQTLADPLAKSIEMKRRASAVQSRIESGRSDVAAAIANFDQRLLQLDTPPLWSADPATANVDAFQQGLDIEVQFASAYSQASPANLKALRAFELLLLPMLLWLFHRSRRSAASMDSTGHNRTVLTRPVSTWLLLSMMAVPALEPDAPLLVSECALLIALIPMLRLLPPHSRRLLGAWPYVTIALYVLDRIGVAAMAGSSATRLYQLVLTALALLLTLWLLRRMRRSQTAASGPLAQKVRTIGWTAAALLCIAFVANVIGNVSLAAMLTSGVIDSGYLAILLHAGVTACLAIWRSLLAQPEVARLRLVKDNEPFFDLLMARALPLLASLGWLLYTMDRFRLLRPAQTIGSALLNHDFQIGEISISLEHLLVFAVSVLIAFWSARIVRRLLKDELQGRAELPRGVGNSIASLTYYAVLILGFLVALSAAGFKVTQLALVFGALGVGIGFGLQNIVNNFVSGLVLMFERPIRPGDVIEISGITGRVRQIGMRATILRTFDGADVVVPNGTLLTANLSNWTLFDNMRRVEVEVSLDHDSDPAQVLPIFMAVALATPGIATEPAPSVVLKGVNDSSLSFAVRVWTNDYDRWVDLRGELQARLLKAVAEAGLRIPYNQLDLNLRTVSDQAAGALYKRTTD